MESVKINVTHRDGETIVKSDKGVEFKFGGKILSETAIASLVFQTVYVNFEKLRDVSEKFEINLTMDYTVHQDETQVDFLRLKIKQGSWYKCVKDVMDNKCEVRLFTKDEYYLCPKDGMLVTDNNKTIQWQEWHHPEDCFIEENPVTYKEEKQGEKETTWDKEDEENMNNILYVFNQLKGVSFYKEDDTAEKIINWLKSLKDRLCSNNEYDKDMLGAIEYCVKNNRPLEKEHISWLEKQGQRNKVGTHSNKG